MCSCDGVIVDTFDQDKIRDLINLLKEAYDHPSPVVSFYASEHFGKGSLTISHGMLTVEL